MRRCEGNHDKNKHYVGTVINPNLEGQDVHGLCCWVGIGKLPMLASAPQGEFSMVMVCARRPARAEHGHVLKWLWWSLLPAVILNGPYGW